MVYIYYCIVVIIITIKLIIIIVIVIIRIWNRCIKNPKYSMQLQCRVVLTNGFEIFKSINPCYSSVLVELKRMVLLFVASYFNPFYYVVELFYRLFL